MHFPSRVPTCSPKCLRSNWYINPNLVLRTNYSRSLNFFYITFSVCYSPVATVQLTSLLRKCILWHLDPGEGNEAVETHKSGLFLFLLLRATVFGLRPWRGFLKEVCVNHPFLEILRQWPEQLSLPWECCQVTPPRPSGRAGDREGRTEIQEDSADQRFCCSNEDQYGKHFLEYSAMKKLLF